MNLTSRYGFLFPLFFFSFNNKFYFFRLRHKLQSSTGVLLSFDLHHSSEKEINPPPKKTQPKEKTSSVWNFLCGWVPLIFWWRRAKEAEKKGRWERGREMKLRKKARTVMKINARRGKLNCRKLGGS